MSAAAVVSASQWFFIGYFALLTLGYLILNVTAYRRIRETVNSNLLDDLPARYSGHEPPVSIIVPAYNEERTIVASLRSLLQLDFPEFEIVVVNDGSADDTMKVMQSRLDLRPLPIEVMRTELHSAAVRSVWQSLRYPNLRVIDKDNGGKADALNAGANLARYTLICSVDADSILQRDSLRQVVRPFIDDPATIAAGGTVRVANGCEVKDGFLTRIGLPKTFLAGVQIVEYLRAFLFGRLGWDRVNGLLIISGAFGVFDRDALVSIGGYRHETVGEDMDLVVRLHRHYRACGERRPIRFVPDPVCWTEVPTDLRTLGNQRRRWQRGLSESLAANWRLLFARNAGAAGRLAMPFMIAFEWMSPLVELVGYVIFAVAAWHGWLSWPIALLFMGMAMSTGILLSLSALLLEQASFHLYPRTRQMLLLAVYAVIENFGYRQLNAWWRLQGVVSWMARRRQQWGRMTRAGDWQSSDDDGSEH